MHTYMITFAQAAGAQAAVLLNGTPLGPKTIQVAPMAEEAEDWFAGLWKVKSWEGYVITAKNGELTLEGQKGHSDVPAGQYPAKYVLLGKERVHCTGGSAQINQRYKSIGNLDYHDSDLIKWKQVPGGFPVVTTECWRRTTRVPKPSTLRLTHLYLHAYTHTRVYSAHTHTYTLTHTQYKHTHKHKYNTQTHTHRRKSITSHHITS